MIPALRGNPRVDPVLVGTILGLVTIGTVMVGSASVYIAEQLANDPRHFFGQHLLALGIGMVGMLFALRIPTDWWNRTATLWLVVALGMLVFVLLPGVAERINGAKRWIDLGLINLQPSELARVLLLVYVVSYSVRRHEALSTDFAGFLRPVLLICLAAVLLIQEPDFGATALLMATTIGILFLAGARLRDLAVCGFGAVAAGSLLIYADSERLERLQCSWINPWQDQYDCGYQLVNSIIAIGSGSWFGAGLGAGVQKLAYLPDAHTDFIFAVLSEELGFIGATLVVVLFSMLVYRAFELGFRARESGLPFHALLIMGIALMLGLQAVVSIGVNTGLLPTKGLTLPLISFGRTSTVVTLFALGLLIRAAHEVAAAGNLSPRGSAA
jgi:cell division protein FtsW